jgi:hypothetical protein
VELDLPELLRIKSQILAARHDRESAMNCLTEALAVARAQSALAWELRSAMALARMLREDDQRDQARHALALVYDRFTKDAKPRISSWRARCLRICDSHFSHSKPSR